MLPIRYKSTRGHQFGLSFKDAVLGGLASDNGLFVPDNIPSFSESQIRKMRTMTFSEVAYEIIASFVQDDDIPSQHLKRIINDSFTNFRSKDVTPTVKVGEFWILELFHGPTFAFKDVALQFLGNIFQYFLAEDTVQNSITVLGATSGDTGSAAIHGLRNKENIECFIMFPLGKVTEVQERQMTTIQDKNIHCIGIEGDFDDAQAIVKAAFADKTFRKEVKLGAVNSINWARVLAQITYYFYAYMRVTDDDVNSGKDDECNHGITVGINTADSYHYVSSKDNLTDVEGATSKKESKKQTQLVTFAVPTGNFGDILAGYYAKRMGLPIDKLIICCTDDNNILHRFLCTGVYSCVDHPAVPTVAPSMDISVSSNFERYLYYLAEMQVELSINDLQDTATATAITTVNASMVSTSASIILADWMEQFEQTGQVSLPLHLWKIAQTDFASYSCTQENILRTIRDMFHRSNNNNMSSSCSDSDSCSSGSSSSEGYLICPHTATAVAAVQHMLLLRKQEQHLIQQAAAAEPMLLSMNSSSSSNSRNANSSIQTHAASIAVCLATAHPAKFEEAVCLALSNYDRDVNNNHNNSNYDTSTNCSSNTNDAVSSFVLRRPAELQALFSMPTYKVSLPNSLEAVIAYIRSQLQRKHE